MQSPPDAAARPRSVFLHVGAMKTGTTYVQEIMKANRAELSAQGLWFAGDHWGEQVRAAQDLVGMGRHDPDVSRLAAGRWDALARRIADRPEPVSVISMEFLGFAGAAQARRAVASLRPAQVHVILTIRDSARVVPALWQTSVTSGETLTWEEFEAGVRRAAAGSGRLSRVKAITDSPARRFREALHVPHILKTWVDAAGADQVHVVTVPRPGSPADALWARFAAVLDLDPAACPHPARDANESLGLASTELVRRVNLTLGLDSMLDHNKTVKDVLAYRGLAPRRSAEARAALDARTRERMLEWNDTIRSAVVRAGVEVAGSLEDLPVADDVHEASPVHLEPTEDELLAAARDGFAELRRLVRKRAHAVRSRKKRRRRLGRVRRGLTGPACWRETPDPVASAVADLALLCRTAIDLRRKRVRRRRRRAARG